LGKVGSEVPYSDGLSPRRGSIPIITDILGIESIYHDNKKITETYIKILTLPPCFGSAFSSLRLLKYSGAQRSESSRIAFFAAASSITFF